MIRASYGEMKSAANEITNAADNYKMNVEKLYKEVEQLDSAWKGVDNQEYVNKVNSYKSDMTSLGTAVAGYAEFLQRAADALNATQEDIKNEAGRL